MYAAIHYLSTATSADVLSDIVGLATGTITTVGGITADHNAAGSFITNTVSAGWTLWDDVDANNKVIRSAISDDGTRYKYLKFETGSYNYDEGVKVESYRDWNNSTHAGTLNRRINSSALDLSDTFTIGDFTAANFIYYREGSSSTTTATQMLLSIDPNHLCAANNTNDLTNCSGVTIASEHTRLSPWDTVANAYDPFTLSMYPVSSGSFTAATDEYRNWFSKPYYPDAAGSDTDINVGGAGQGVIHSMTVATHIGSGFIGTLAPNGPGALSSLVSIPDEILDENKVLHKPLISFGCHQSYYGNFGGDISSKSGIYITSAVGNMNDIITVGGNDYRIWLLAHALPSNIYGTAQALAILEV